MKRPKRENYPNGIYGDIDYDTRMERYCTYLENKLEKAINYSQCCKSDSELLSKRPNTSSTWECFTKAEKQQKGNV